MNRYIKYALAFALPAVALTACDDYLDTMPDNRATVNEEEDIQKLLTSAYPDCEFSLVAEISSDNVDDVGSFNQYTDRFFDDIYNWKDEAEVFNESLSRYWEASYKAISSANQAIAAIEALGGINNDDLKGLYGEALLCRAYNHFMLAQLFCKPWTQNAVEDAGLPYMLKPETKLRPEYERGNLADFYTNIETDLTEGLKYISDAHLKVPKYHFNTKAAYAFATKFYATVEQWEKSAEMATICLGSQPQALLRNYAAQAALPIEGSNGLYNEPQAVEYINTTNSCNLMLVTAKSRLGWVFGRTATLSRYCHHKNLSGTEGIEAQHPWGNTRRIFASYPSTGFTYVLMRKVFCAFEYTDIVAQTGYVHAVIPVLTTDETLLYRAEAYTMLHEYSKAAADLTLWAQNFTTNCPVLTPESITNFYKAKDYAYTDGLASSVKKHLNPAFAIDAEGSVQESLLQCVLDFRRIETLHFGFRWFDIRRYGIEIPRRVLNASGIPATRTDVLTQDDERRTFQIPLQVRDAGLAPNPRKSAVDQ